ncbi:hypothetical protein [Kaistella sp.]|uniref:hypothetical protein n=1 Tax=Kaistella sp. TaxID=2782235 RepID=UPI002F957513
MENTLELQTPPGFGMKGISPDTEAKLSNMIAELPFSHHAYRQSFIEKLFDIALTIGIILSLFGLSLVVVGCGIALCKMALSL